MIVVKLVAVWFVVPIGLGACAVLANYASWRAAVRRGRSTPSREAAARLRNNLAVLAEADKIIADAHRARSIRHHPSQEYPDHHG